MEDSENTDPCCLYRIKNCYNIFFGDTRQIVQLKLRMHFDGILNSQLMYTVKLLMMKGGLTLILSCPKACGFFYGFAVQISVASSMDLLVLAFGIVKLLHLANASKTASVTAEQRALLVFPARNSIKDLFAA